MWDSLRRLAGCVVSKPYSSPPSQYSIKKCRCVLVCIVPYKDATKGWSTAQHANTFSAGGLMASGSSCHWSLCCIVMKVLEASQQNISSMVNTMLLLGKLDGMRLAICRVLGVLDTHCMFGQLRSIIMFLYIRWWSEADRTCNACSTPQAVYR